MSFTITNAANIDDKRATYLIYAPPGTGKFMCQVVIREKYVEVE